MGTLRCLVVVPTHNEATNIEEILARLDAQDVPSAPLLSRMELMEHEQILVNESVDRTVHEGFGEVRQARPAAQFSATPVEIRAPAPTLGQHSREILAALGYASDAQAALIDGGAVTAAD